MEKVRLQSLRPANYLKAEHMDEGVKNTKFKAAFVADQYPSVTPDAPRSEVYHVFPVNSTLTITIKRYSPPKKR